MSHLPLYRSGSLKSLKANGNKKYFISTKTDTKIIYRSLLQNSISGLFHEIFSFIIKPTNCLPS